MLSRNIMVRPSIWRLMLLRTLIDHIISPILTASHNVDASFSESEIILRRRVANRGFALSVFHEARVYTIYRRQAGFILLMICGRRPAATSSLASIISISWFFVALHDACHHAALSHVILPRLKPLASHRVPCQLRRWRAVMDDDASNASIIILISGMNAKGDASRAWYWKSPSDARSCFFDIFRTSAASLAVRRMIITQRLFGA